MEIPEGSTSQCCTIKQNHKYKIYWDIFIIVLLLFVCVVIPFRIAFVKVQDSAWTLTFAIIDGFFFVDMVLTFFTSVSDEQKMTEISDKKVIAKRYFEFWFWVDIVSIFPFDQFSKIITGSSQSNTASTVLVRSLKMGKISKLIRLMRLLKVFKIMKNSS